MGHFCYKDHQGKDGYGRRRSDLALWHVGMVLIVCVWLIIYGRICHLQSFPVVGLISEDLFFFLLTLLRTTSNHFGSVMPVFRIFRYCCFLCELFCSSTKQKSVLLLISKVSNFILGTGEKPQWGYLYHVDQEVRALPFSFEKKRVYSRPTLTGRKTPILMMLMTEPYYA